MFSCIWDSMDSTISGLDHHSEPSTHALVVGIGRYANAQALPNPIKPNPLIQPVDSALAIAHWLIKHRDSLLKPLGTVTLLLSDPRLTISDSLATRAKLPTITNLQLAVDAWFDVLNRDNANFGFFFACGHGVFSNGQEYLLAEDYGSRPRDPFENIVALRDFFTTMKTCKASNQVFFADCCQEVVPRMQNELVSLKGYDFGGANASDIKYGERGMMFSTTVTNKAIAGKRITPFTEALLKALDSGAAKKILGGSWSVTFQQLTIAVPEIMRRINGNASPLRQDAELSREMEVCRLSDPPDIDVDFRCSPRKALSDAELVVFDRQSRPIHRICKASAPHVCYPVPAGSGYEATVTFPSTSLYRNGQEYFDVEPLMFPVEIVCT